jgi:replicative DNA helicase
VAADAGVCCNIGMSDGLISAADALVAADEALADGGRAAPQPLPTGLGLLDTYLGGGLRGGELCVLGGQQGLGKTALALQAARYAASVDESAVVFSYEHDATTLLARLVSLEAGELYGPDGVPLRRVREALEGSGRRGSSLEERLAAAPGGPEAVSALRGYGDRLLLHRSSGSATGVPQLREVVGAALERTGLRPLVVVDYLQKVHAGSDGSQEDRAARVAAGLKELALTFEVPVLAVVAAGPDGLAPGQRLRVHHLRGASALAYEADVVLVLNEKYDVVARHHLMYDTRAVDRFREYVVITIEKNRAGLSRIDLQVRKRLEQSRFERAAESVPEELVDERVFAG